MNKKKLFLGLFMCCFSLGGTLYAQLQTKIDQTLQRAVKQYTYMGTLLEDGKFPKTYYADTDTFEASNSGWWCSGFYAGTLLYLDEALGTDTFTAALEKNLGYLEKEQYNKTTHDLGFMMYCSFGNALRLTQNPAYESILLNSAKSLSTRYNDTVKAIRSWDSASWNNAGEGDLVVIIDNMMNLELLFWASEYSGDPRFREIAINHANTTMAHHYRDDYSSYHELVYDEQTGAVKKKITAQGYADESAWSRGQAWGLYGYVLMYRETKDPVYLEFAEHIADFVLNHPNMPEDLVPYWDYNAPDIPNALRDTSAGAVIASALLELSTYTDGKYLDKATKQLESLLSDAYLAKEGTNGGFLLKHGVGNIPGGTEIDVPLSYGDYYLVEAMLRYKELQK